MSPPQVENPVVLFDGVCNLCTGSVKFIIKRDPSGKFRFASLQSEAGKSLASEYELLDDRTDSLILLEQGRSYIKSTAALKICHELNALWPMLYAFIIIPSPIRDYLYDIVARNRYKWFGKKEECMVPNSDIQGRFLS